MLRDFQELWLIDHYDGKTITCSRRGLSLNLNACDRITVKARIHWLPISVSNEDLAWVLESRGDIKSLNHVTENNIITDVREVVFSMREGDQNHPPYLTSVHGHIACPRPTPICFNTRASVTLDTNILMEMDLDYEVIHGRLRRKPNFHDWEDFESFSCWRYLQDDFLSRTGIDFWRRGSREHCCSLADVAAWHLVCDIWKLSMLTTTMAKQLLVPDEVFHCTWTPMTELQWKSKFTGSRYGLVMKNF